MKSSIDKNINTNVNIRSLKAKVLECKGKLLKSEFWGTIVEHLETEIFENWIKGRKCSSSRCILRGRCICYNDVFFVIGLGSLESTINSNLSSFFQLAAVVALSERINLEGIYFCDPEFTQADRELIFELFMEFETHIEVFTSHDLSIPLNTVNYQLKNKLYGRDSQINILFFMPHCDRCVFGMIINYFNSVEGKTLYSDSARMIVWGNNLETFQVDSNENFNKRCEYCKALSTSLSKMNFSTINFPVNDYKTIFCSSFSDLSIYHLPVS
ncbi:Sensitivity To Red Light Reduced-like protein [Cryptosporidium tyzzeri]|nr:Sensitivity To Red Light Reduced-like protein [Cryptosporidium tyzzeri]